MSPSQVRTLTVPTKGISSIQRGHHPHERKNDPPYIQHFAMCGESNRDRPQHPWQLCLQISKSLTMVKTHNALLSPSNPTMNQNAKENMSATRCSLIGHPEHNQHLYAAAFHLMSHSTCRNSTIEEQRPVSSKFQPREIPDSPMFTLKISRLSLSFTLACAPSRHNLFLRTKVSPHSQPPCGQLWAHRNVNP